MKTSYICGLVSVIIPTYKRADTLRRTITSIKNQTYTKIEILVVDDNEPGDEYSCAVKLLLRDLAFDNIVLITQDKHKNGATARNAGIKEARGEFIAFLDDDDLWMPEKIEKQINMFTKLDGSFGGVSTRKAYFRNGKLTHISEKWVPDNKQNYNVMAKRLNISTCTLFLKRSCLDECGYFNEELKRHQEIQLLSFFTSKYLIGFCDEILTIIDCSDVTNRPDAESLNRFKEEYFSAISGPMARYSKHKQRLIKAHNMTEVAWATFRDGLKCRGIMMLSAYIKYPSVFIGFCERVVGKKKSVRALNNLDKCTIDNILACIENSDTGSS